MHFAYGLIYSSYRGVKVIKSWCLESYCPKYNKKYSAKQFKNGPLRLAHMGKNRIKNQTESKIFKIKQHILKT